MNLAATIDGDPIGIPCEPQGIALRFGRRQPKRIEAHDHRRVRGHRLTMAERVPGIRERTTSCGESLVDAVAELDEERTVAEGLDARIAQVR